MNLFRSEEHIVRWLAGRAPGETISVTKLAQLSDEWWSDRLAPDWRPHTRDQNQAILEGIGLTGDFWTLPLTHARSQRSICSDVVNGVDSPTEGLQPFSWDRSPRRRHSTANCRIVAVCDDS